MKLGNLRLTTFGLVPIKTDCLSLERLPERQLMDLADVVAFRKCRVYALLECLLAGLSKSVH